MKEKCCICSSGPLWYWFWLYCACCSGCCTVFVIRESRKESAQLAFTRN